MILKVETELKNMEEFQNIMYKAGMEYPSLDQSGDFCYLYTIVQTNTLNVNVSVADFLELCSGDNIVLQYSVTSLEPRYREWVDCALSVPGASIVELKRFSPVRTVYLCTVPTTPNMDSI